MNILKETYEYMYVCVSVQESFFLVDDELVSVFAAKVHKLCMQ